MSPVVVADASPLIFLSKVQRLELVFDLLGGPVLVPRVVRDELLCPPIDPVEEQRLAAFLERCETVVVQRPRRMASALSAADNQVITLALRRRARWILADDHLLRQVARGEQLAVIGTLGLLLQAQRRSLLGAGEVRALIEQLIRLHGLRISIEVFQAVLRSLEEIGRQAE